jgi:hypothetical protein
MTKVISLVLALLLGFSAISAQELTPEPDPNQIDTSECPVIVRTALSLTQQRCSGTGINQICYGHLVLDAQPRTGLADFGFNEPGDIVNVIEVQSLRLSALNTENGRWGVVMMQVDANTNPPLANQPQVQMLLFGDAELNDATRFLPGFVTEPVNVRIQPSLNSPVLSSLNANAEITANGRLDDGSWLRINLSDQNGWIRSDLVTLSGDPEWLPAVNASAAGTDPTLAEFGPMQAFYFRSGVEDAPCAEAPNSGMLIQTPEGIAAISIWMDEVVIQMNATAFIQAQPDGSLTVRVIEGSAQVTAFDTTRTVASGMQVSVPLNANLAPSDAPSDPVPYEDEAMQALPIALLNRPVTIPAPRAQPANRPISGAWDFSWDTAELTCPDGTVVPFESTGALSTIQVDDETLRWNANQYIMTTAGVYRSSYTDQSGNLHQDTLQVLAPDRIRGEKIIDLASPVCTLDVGFSLQLVTPSE